MVADDQPSPNDADVMLAHRAGAGERAARAELAHRLFARVRRVVRRLAQGQADYEDIATEAMMEILRCASSFEGRSKLESWANRVAIRVAMRHLKKRRSRAQVVRLVPDPERNASRQSVVDLDGRVRRGRVEVLLDKLTPERRTALVLKLVHGYSVREIAELTETPENTVRDRLRVGRKHLRAHVLRDKGLSAELEGRRP